MFPAKALLTSNPPTSKLQSSCTTATGKPVITARSMIWREQGNKKKQIKREKGRGNWASWKTDEMASSGNLLTNLD